MIKAIQAKPSTGMTFSPTPAPTSPSESVAAPAEVGQGLGTPHPEKTGWDKFPDSRFVLAKGSGPGIWNCWETHVSGYRVFWGRVHSGYLA